MKKSIYKSPIRIPRYAFMGILAQLLLAGLCLAQVEASQPIGSNTYMAYAGEKESDKTGYSHADLMNSNLRIEVSGTVTGPDGRGIPGVNILIKGTGTGTVSDVDGRYAINAPNNDDVLVFSSIGYVTQEVPIGGRSVVDVALAEDLRGLEEVVVIGYGTRKKVNLTG